MRRKRTPGKKGRIDPATIMTTDKTDNITTRSQDSTKRKGKQEDVTTKKGTTRSPTDQNMWQDKLKRRSKTQAFPLMKR